MILSLSIAGLHSHAAQGPWRTSPRAAIEWAASLGFHSVHLDAATPGLRPRELDRSARRDVAATLRRCGLMFTGLDLWIPPEHYADPATADRSMAALSGAVELASEIDGLCGGAGAVVSTTLPADTPESLHSAISDRADLTGVPVEDYALGELPANEDGLVKPGLDTAKVILRGGEPTAEFAHFASSLASLRINDADDTGRRPVGHGRLDVAAMRALHETLTPMLAVVTDLRGLPDPAVGAASAIQRWSALRRHEGGPGGTLP